MVAFAYSQTLELDNGKSFQLQWTRAAQKKLDAQSEPLIMELELYFSCLVKKFVHFYGVSDVRNADLIAVNDQISVWFHPVHSVSCAPDEAAERQPHKDVDRENIPRVFPSRALLDVKQGQWCGEYFL